MVHPAGIVPKRLPAAVGPVGKEVTFVSIELLVIASLAGACGVWVLYYLYQERKKKQEETRWEVQRAALGIKPGTASRDSMYPVRDDDEFTRKYNRARSVSRRRCPRGVCTTPGGSCPTECVEEPQVIRHSDGGRTHKYDNLEVCFGPDGKVQALKVDDRNWS